MILTSAKFVILNLCLFVVVFSLWSFLFQNFDCFGLLLRELHSTFFEHIFSSPPVEHFRLPETELFDDLFGSVASVCHWSAEKRSKIKKKLITETVKLKKLAKRIFRI